MTSYPAACKRCTRPAARNAAGAFSVPAKNAAALDGAPIKAIFFGCRVIFAAKFAPLRLPFSESLAVNRGRKHAQQVQSFFHSISNLSREITFAARRRCELAPAPE